MKPFQGLPPSVSERSIVLGQDTEKKEEIRGERKAECKKRRKGEGGRMGGGKEREIGYVLGSEAAERRGNGERDE
jgi:hypothetical protein